MRRTVSSFQSHYILLHLECAPSFTPDSISLLPLLTKVQVDCFGQLASVETSLIWLDESRFGPSEVVVKLPTTNASQFLAAIPLLPKPINDCYLAISVISHSNSLVSLAACARTDNSSFNYSAPKVA
ncbi:hypothetical protein CROQUDRAFT_669259 [Cronartium quercuum f. sp. fusiforme G11]|uniref:Uncharacterized protein n=1 Tax=Cronartium quercuum f. sp. fusiforme G11 TaxID=708437 RepID=A0A9P6TF58_9BASI|nr:hypothetical protein CROQUDRAFT_669259 [Cronartium quercuum f. sp. fusiforme G11]